MMREPGFWNNLFAKTLTVYANLIFAVLWGGFVIALIVNHGWLHELWTWVGTLPLMPRITVWLLILPIMVGLWIWESSWSPLVRIVSFAGIVGWTVLAVTSIFRNFR